MKPATPLKRNSPINTKGNSLIVSGSLSTKLPSNNGLINAANAVSVTANIAIARTATVNIILYLKVYCNNLKYKLDWRLKFFGFCIFNLTKK